VGSNDFHPEFEKGLIGLKRGESKTIKIEFPEDYKNIKLAGKIADFKVKIKDIKIMDIPPLNDDFAKMVGSEFNTLDELREKLKEELIKREEERIDRELKSRALQIIGEKVEFELPESLVDFELNKAIENIRENLKRTGSSIEKAGLNEEKLRNDLRPASEKRVKNMLILEEIASKENIEISENELMDGFKEIALKMGQDPQVVKNYYEQNNMIDSLKRSLLEEKTLNYIINNAKIKVVEKDKLKESDHIDKGDEKG